MKKKEIVLDITHELYLIKKTKRKNYLCINNKEKYKKLIKNGFKLYNAFFAIVDFEKFKLFQLVNIFFLINKNFKIYKNFLIFFDFKKEITAHNFFPDWPGEYKFSNYLKSLFFWLKQIVSNFIFFKKIRFIVIKFK